MRLGIKEIEQILPHRHPFLLVDYIEEMEPGVSAVGYKCVTFHEDFFRGHFPQEPVMPGVLQIEALAQVGAVAILSKPENKGKTAYFGAINNAKFKTKVVPGDVLTLELEIIKEKGWIQISDEGAIKEVVMKILEANPQSVADFKAGKDRALGFLVGQAMKETKGKANPKMLNEMFLAELNK